MSNVCEDLPNSDDGMGQFLPCHRLVNTMKSLNALANTGVAAMRERCAVRIEHLDEGYGSAFAELIRALQIEGEGR